MPQESALQAAASRPLVRTASVALIVPEWCFLRKRSLDVPEILAALTDPRPDKRPSWRRRRRAAAARPIFRGSLAAVTGCPGSHNSLPNSLERPWCAAASNRRAATPVNCFSYPALFFLCFPLYSICTVQQSRSLSSAVCITPLERLAGSASPVKALSARQFSQLSRHLY